MLVVALLVTRARAWVAGLVGWFLAAAVEALQAVGIADDVVARVPQARWVLGTTFVPTDLAWYSAGALLGALVVALARADWSVVPVRHTTAPPRVGRRARITALVTAPLVLALAAGGAVAWTLRAEARDLRAELPAAQAALAASTGKVADEATRVRLEDALADAATVLGSTPFLERWPGDAPEAGDTVAAQVAAVTASRLTKARSVAAEARDALAPVTARGESILAATDGLGADPAVRDALATLLSRTASAVAEAGDDRLATATDPIAVEQAGADLAAAKGSVAQATVDLMTAQDAHTCPFPDQVWFPESGKLADANLAPIPWEPAYRIRADLVPGLVALDDAFRARFGHHLDINSAYRSFDEQVEVYNPSDPNPLAAVPGCSNHGLGTAVDIDDISSPDSAEYAWLKANANQYGWTHPDWAEPTGRLPEPWHWQSVETPTTYQ